MIRSTMTCGKVLARFGGSLPRQLAAHRCQLGRSSAAPSRSFAVCSRSNSAKQQSFDVSPFGRLVVNPGTCMDMKISHLNPQEYPLQNKVLVSQADSETVTVKIQCRSSGDEVFVDSSCTSDREKRSPGTNVPCDVQVPIRFDLDLVLEEKSSVQVDTLENKCVSIQVDAGSCLLKEIKTDELTVSSNTGDIRTEGMIQGNTHMRTGSGNVAMHKSLCRDLVMTSDSGDLHVTSLYADQSEFRTRSGNVHIGSGHRNIAVDIAEKGNLKIDTLDGSLVVRVQHGTVDVHITRHLAVDIRVETGDVILRLPESIMTSLKLRAPSITVSDDLNTSQLFRSKDVDMCHLTGRLLGSGSTPSAVVMEDNDDVDEASIVASTNTGSIQVLCQDWLSTLNLGQLRRDD